MFGEHQVPQCSLKYVLCSYCIIPCSDVFLLALLSIVCDDITRLNFHLSEHFQKLAASQKHHG